MQQQVIMINQFFILNQYMHFSNFGNKHNLNVLKGFCSMRKVTYSGGDFGRLKFIESKYYFYKKDPKGNDVYQSLTGWYLFFLSTDSQWLVSII